MSSEGGRGEESREARDGSGESKEAREGGWGREGQRGEEGGRGEGGREGDGVGRRKRWRDGEEEERKGG